MAKILECAKVDRSSGCQHVVRGETEEEVLQKAGEHAQEHGIRQVTPELIARPEVAGADILLGTDVSRSGTLVGDNLTLAPGEGLILRLRGAELAPDVRERRTA